MDDLIKSKLDPFFRECDAHLGKLRRSSTLLGSTFPLTEQSLKNMAEESITILDQFFNHL